MPLARILIISCCKLCCSCLCSVSLPHGAVGWSGVSEHGIFWSLSNCYILQLTQIMTLIRLQGCTGYSVRSFFACNEVWFSRGPNCWYQPLSVYWYQYYLFCINPCETLKRVLLQTENTQMKCCSLSGHVLTVKVNYLQTKEYNMFWKLQPDTLYIYNGLTQGYCIKPEGRIN